MKTRIGIGVTLMAGLFGILYADHRAGSDLGFTFLVCLAVGLGVHEFTSMYEAQSGVLPKRFVSFLGLCLVVASWILRHSGHAEWVPAMLFLALLATTVLAAIFVLGLFPDIVLGPGAERVGG